MPDVSEGYLAALETELWYAKQHSAGGQPPKPDRIRVIEVEIDRVRKLLGHSTRKSKAARETTVVVPPDENTDA